MIGRTNAGGSLQGSGQYVWKKKTKIIDETQYISCYISWLYEEQKLFFEFFDEPSGDHITEIHPNDILDIFTSQESEDEEGDIIINNGNIVARSETHEEFFVLSFINDYTYEDELQGWTRELSEQSSDEYESIAYSGSNVFYANSPRDIYSYEYVTSNNKDEYPENGKKDGFIYELITPKYEPYSLLAEMFGYSIIAVDKFTWNISTSLAKLTLEHSLGTRPRYCLFVDNKQSISGFLTGNSLAVQYDGNPTGAVSYLADDNGISFEVEYTNPILISSGIEYTLITMA